MDKQKVIKHFGDVRKTAEAFGISTQSVYAWGDLVPKAIALEADLLTKGKLKYQAARYRNE